MHVSSHNSQHNKGCSCKRTLEKNEISWLLRVSVVLPDSYSMYLHLDTHSFASNVKLKTDRLAANPMPLTQCTTHFSSSSDLFCCNALARAVIPVEVRPLPLRLQ